MSKPVDLNTYCPCGNPMEFRVNKPKAFTPQTTKITCSECKSIFLVRTKIGRKDRGVDIELGIQELSPECEKILRRVIDDRSKGTPAGDEPRRADSPVEVSDV